MKNNKKAVNYYSGWISQLGSVPVEIIAEHDKSQDYETDRSIVYKLENGKYAYVHECGCSCYESNDAEIEVYDKKSKALNSFEEWKG